MYAYIYICTCSKSGATFRGDKERDKYIRANICMRNTHIYALIKQTETPKNTTSVPLSEAHRAGYCNLHNR